jgi:hypothetical protein
LGELSCSFSIGRRWREATDAPQEVPFGYEGMGFQIDG